MAGLTSTARMRGTSFVELMIAVSIVGVAVMVMLTQITISFRENSESENRGFAYRKGMQILAEVQNGIERGSIPDAESLDALVDLEGFNPRLTTLADSRGEAFDPEHSMSGNLMRFGTWLWGRVLEVEQPEGQPILRYIRVHVYKRRDNGGWDRMAVVTGVVSLRARAAQSTKFYDVYVLALADTPLFYSDRGKVDLRDVAREQIYLNLPLKPVCGTTCAGLCPACGANRNRIKCSCCTVQPDPRLAPLLALKKQSEGGPDS